jgi:hypothetical protein
MNIPVDRSRAVREPPHHAVTEHTDLVEVPNDGHLYVECFGRRLVWKVVCLSRGRVGIGGGGGSVVLRRSSVCVYWGRDGKSGRGSRMMRKLGNAGGESPLWLLRAALTVGGGWTRMRPLFLCMAL